MANSNLPPISKLQNIDDWVRIPVKDAVNLSNMVLKDVGCSEPIAKSVTNHLINSDLAGVGSHGLWRLFQYIEGFKSGYLNIDAPYEISRLPTGGWCLNGGSNIGIPAMEKAADHLIEQTLSNGMSAIAIRDVGHTGRIGAFAELAAKKGLFCFIVGGSGRENWRQVAPYGGTKALLPTNPYAMAMPGGEKGPVVIDFATSIIAGGWIYSARKSNASLPSGAIIDRDGNDTTDPEDYFDGGAILPFGGAKGYGLSVMAEMIAEAMLGPSTTECHWFMVGINTSLYRDPVAQKDASEAVLSELRNCPPAPGFDQVEIPGERERRLMIENNALGLPLPRKVWEDLQQLTHLG